MKILFAASEAHPFLKTGGLGDVAYALPKALKRCGIDVRVIIPNYGNICDYFKKRMKTIAEFGVPVGWRDQYCGLKYFEQDNVPFYFIDNEYYFKRPQAYGYYDDGERFSYFSRAVLEAINYMGDFTPDIIHCNDWQTAIIPVILKDLFRSSERHSKIKTLYTIHNLKYQGVFPKNILNELLCLDEGYFNEDALKFYDCISFMKGGIKFSDKVSTVSYTYSQEIKTPFFGEKLDGLLSSRSNDLWGILNGIDYEMYNPASDINLPYKYDANNIYGKVNNKIELQRHLNLPVNGNIPMIGMITRLVSQKGIDILSYVFDELMKENIQFVLIGTGERRYEDTFRYFAYKYPSKVSANILFDNNLAQKLYAASDMFLMPSLFEPCGIGQLIALRYGSLPIVRETGGLKDTIHSYNEFTGEGNGFSFTNYNAYDMLNTIKRAIHFYYDKNVWENLVRRAMRENNSWEKSAHIYIDLYNDIMG